MAIPWCCATDSHKVEDGDTLNWTNFLLDQKDGSLHPEVLRLKWEKAGGLKEGTLTNHIAKDWDWDNVVEKSSSQLMMTDEVVKHFWEGNLKTLIYSLPDPLPLERPCKFLIYVQYKLHQTLLKKVLQIQGWGLVKYNRTMFKSKHAAVIAKFKGDDMLDHADQQCGSCWPEPDSHIHCDLCGRLWRYGQLAEVIVIDIFTPQGLDLVLVGYAGGKTLMSDAFLLSEQEFHQAHKTITQLEHQDDLSKDNEDNEENR
ncbi:hypothetical protein FRC06_000140 [Ceratobasidium sp. 370]|nr:hypothetical protein FRC06_000140 [Ceratobasidium sp. 370]